MPTMRPGSTFVAGSAAAGGAATVGVVAWTAGVSVGVDDWPASISDAKDSVTAPDGRRASTAPALPGCGAVMATGMCGARRSRGLP